MHTATFRRFFVCFAFVFISLVSFVVYAYRFYCRYGCYCYWCCVVCVFVTKPIDIFHKSIYIVHIMNNILNLNSLLFVICFSVLLQIHQASRAYFRRSMNAEITNKIRIQRLNVLFPRYLWINIQMYSLIWLGFCFTVRLSTCW